ncbi:caskin-2-like [Limulus polyphemus]|uniref:Caskin-2-like n=1 Tax=Limulus polyphemus TaxID=6850 RepID=A0ABM1BV29_LIMPO|nr:caskin-2-like [Limulus polyphemus]
MSGNTGCCGMPRKLLVGGMHRKTSSGLNSIKKVAPPVVPALTIRNSSNSFHSDYGTMDRKSCGSLGDGDIGIQPSLHSPLKELSYPTSPSRRSHHFKFTTCQNIHTQAVVHPQPCSLSSSPTSRAWQASTKNIKPTVFVDDQEIKVCQKSGKESPGGSSRKSRHSTSSVDSGRASATDGNSSQRLSVQSFESSSSSKRRSYHSSSSSLGSDERPEESGACAPQVNVAEMFLHGLPDKEIMKTWLSSLHLSQYFELFVQAGYDMATVSRMTPEDLTAVGVKQPNHRLKLKAEIDRLNIFDLIPCHKPDNLLEWLQLLRLEEYYEPLSQQGYNTVSQVAELIWEDLEEIGIKKLGHQKKIMLAIRKVRDFNNGLRHHGNHAMPVTTSSQLSFVGCHSLSDQQYPSQHVTITSIQNQPSPTKEAPVFREFKTFQQSPTSTISPEFRMFDQTTFEQQDIFFSGESSLFSMYSDAFHRSDVQTSEHSIGNRGLSMESLDLLSTHFHHDVCFPTENGSDGSSKPWRTDLLSPADGTMSLHRPRNVVKTRPVAKIPAKTRHHSVGNREKLGASGNEGRMKNEKRETDQQTNTNRLSPWRSVRTSQIYGTLKGKRIPPPLPRKPQLLKVDSKSEESLSLLQDKSFTTCTESSRSHYNRVLNREKMHSSVPNKQQQSPIVSTEILSTHSEVKRIQSVGDGEVTWALLDQNLNTTFNSSTEDALDNKVISQKTRKDSGGSSGSASSTESNFLPFANDNAGTIKQRTPRIQQTVATSSENLVFPCHQRCIPITTESSSLTSSNSLETHTSEMAGIRSNSNNPDHPPGDVIDNIESMLANLTNQLDVMLEIGMLDGPQDT